MRREHECTVVIPVGRVDDEARLQIRSVLAQDTTVPYEVVLSVNTSDATEVAELDELVRSVDDPRLRVVPSHDRRGASHARNVGARSATAPLLAFCDADDVAEPGWLGALLAAMPGHSAVGGALVEQELGHAARVAWRPPATPDGLPTFMGAPYLVSASMAITRAAFDEVGGFDEDLTRCEDIAISFALATAGHRLGFAADSRMHYRQRPGLWSMLRQHYFYGRGMSEVLVRYGIPSSSGPRRPRHLALMKPNGQPVDRRSLASFARRGAIATGRAVGLVTERARWGARRPAPPTPS